MKLRVREGYGCDCDGKRRVGRARFNMVEQQIRYVKEVTDATINQCPWKYLHSPLVHEVFELYRIASTGEGVHQASVYALDPPRIVWEGLLEYQKALQMVRRFDMKKEEEKRNASAKPGVRRG